MSTMKYVRCQNPACSKSNPVEEREENKEYTCIFCGHPFTLPEKAPETKEASVEMENRGTRPPENQQRRKPINRNQRKPVNKNKRMPLR